MLLSVLTIGIWSMYRMQQRTLEQGQRISREGRAIRSAWSFFQDDLSRAVLSYRPIQIQPPINSTNSEPDSEIPTGDSVDFGNSSFNLSSNRPVFQTEFQFQGGSDWLLIDVHRDSYQLPAFSTSLQNDATGAPTGQVNSDFASDSSLSDLTGNGYLSTQTTAPTPFERIMYAWLSEQEIQELSGIQFGNSELTPQGSSESSGNPPMDPINSRRSEFQFPDSSDSVNAKRWLVRIVCDWTWPRETDNQPQGSDTSDASTDDTTDRRNQWLAKILGRKDSSYFRFHENAGSARSSAASDLDIVQSPDEDQLPINENSSQSQVRLLTNDRQPTVDWLPEVVDGKLEYLVDGNWQDTFSATGERFQPDAVRFQYNVDPRHCPVVGGFADSQATQSTENQLESLNDALDDLGPLAQDWEQATGQMGMEPLEFNYVAMYVFQSNVQSTSLDFDNSDSVAPDNAIEGDALGNQLSLRSAVPAGSQRP